MWNLACTYQLEEELQVWDILGGRKLVRWMISESEDEKAVFSLFHALGVRPTKVCESKVSALMINAAYWGPPGESHWGILLSNLAYWPQILLVCISSLMPGEEGGLVCWKCMMRDPRRGRSKHFLDDLRKREYFIWTQWNDWWRYMMGGRVFARIGDRGVTVTWIVIVMVEWMFWEREDGWARVVHFCGEHVYPLIRKWGGPHERKITCAVGHLVCTPRAAKGYQYISGRLDRVRMISNCCNYIYNLILKIIGHKIGYIAPLAQ